MISTAIELKAMLNLRANGRTKCSGLTLAEAICHSLTLSSIALVTRLSNINRLASLLLLCRINKNQSQKSRRIG